MFKFLSLAALSAYLAMPLAADAHGVASRSFGFNRGFNRGFFPGHGFGGSCGVANAFAAPCFNSAIYSQPIVAAPVFSAPVLAAPALACAPTLAAPLYSAGCLGTGAAFAPGYGVGAAYGAGLGYGAAFAPSYGVGFNQGFGIGYSPGFAAGGCSLGYGAAFGTGIGYGVGFNHFNRGFGFNNQRFFNNGFNNGFVRNPVALNGVNLAANIVNAAVGNRGVVGFNRNVRPVAFRR